MKLMGFFFVGVILIDYLSYVKEFTVKIEKILF